MIPHSPTAPGLSTGVFQSLQVLEKELNMENHGSDTVGNPRG
jgi:hypothetical protein